MRELFKKLAAISTVMMLISSLAMADGVDEDPPKEEPAIPPEVILGPY